MTGKVTPKMAEAVQNVTDGHKRQKLLQLLNTLFAQYLDSLEIIQKSNRQRIILSLKENYKVKIGTTDLVVPNKICFDVLQEGSLEFYDEFHSPTEGLYFWNVVKAEKEAYIFERNGVTFNFSAPLVKSIHSLTLLSALEKK